MTNPEAYAKEYAPKAQAIIKSAGGRFLAVGGAAATSGNVTSFDGEAPKRVVLQVWDSGGETLEYPNKLEPSGHRPAGD